MKKRPLLSEAFKISIEIDPKDVEGMHAEPEIEAFTADKRRASRPPPTHVRESNRYGKYVNEFCSRSSFLHELEGLAESLSDGMANIIEDVALRADKRQAIAAEHAAKDNVMRSWRTFLRELASFEKRYR